MDWSKEENATLREIIQRAITAFRSTISLLENENVERNMKMSSISELNEILVKKESDETGCVNTHTKETEWLKDEHLKSTKIDIHTYCKLGHLHLLLEEYDNGWYLHSFNIIDFYPIFT